MKFRSLGRTGLQVSQMSQGGAAFGEQYGKVSQLEVHACVYRAIDVGINLFDTSPYYGLTRAETVLGDALRNGLRQKIYLCSKAGRNGSAEFDFSAPAIERSVDASLKRLQTDYLDILLAHDIEFASNFDQIFSETTEVLHRLKQKGKCRFIGMSGYPLGILREAIQRCSLDVVISYGHFNLQDSRLLTDLLPIANEFGVGVLNASPLSLGLLTEQGPPPWHPATPEMRALAKQAAEYCRARGNDIAMLGMRYCLAEDRITSTITGTAKVEELERNLQAIDSPPDPALVAEVQAILAPVLNRSWVRGNWRTE